MGKKEKKTDALRRDDPKENNWEIPSETEVSRQEDPGIEFMEPGLKMSIASQVVGDVLIQNLMKVDAELRRGNPVWHWCLADDHCTFVFRNGQKVTVKF